MLALLSALSLVLATTSGSSRCPCGSIATLPPTVATELAAYDATLNASIYGIGCAAHDAPRPACTSPATPGGVCNGRVLPMPAECAGVADENLAFCPKAWCYVDPLNCDLTAHHSLATPSAGRYFSYSTCGAVDTLSSARRMLKGKVLRAGVQANTGSWHGSYHPSMVAHTRENVDAWHGPVWDFVHATAAKNGFVINITAPPAAVRNASALHGHGGPYWHCTYGTSMGYTDLCIGMHTVTPERLRLAPWFVMQLNSLFLITKVEDDVGSLTTSLSKVFLPFETEVWVMVIVLVVVVALLVTAQERLVGAMPQSWDDRLSAKDNNPLAGRLEHFKENVVINTRALYDRGVGNSPGAAALTTQLGLGFFILLLSTAYTANFTTFLVSRQQNGRVRSWEEAMERGISVCGTRMGAFTARTVYPGANWAIE